jgi:hypothetical protein
VIFFVVVVNLIYSSYAWKNPGKDMFLGHWFGYVSICVTY